VRGIVWRRTKFRNSVEWSYVGVSELVCNFQFHDWGLGLVFHDSSIRLWRGAAFGSAHDVQAGGLTYEGVCARTCLNFVHECGPRKLVFSHS
jgi:hypothetical protein